MLSTLMSEEHRKLFEILDKFEHNLKDIGLFNTFKWNLKKHFALEERAIFDIYNKIRGEEVAAIFDLMKEHGEILNLIKDVEDSVNNETIKSIEELKSVLDRHHKFEDKEFYPKLDEDLNPEQKQEIREKIEAFIE